MYPILEGKVIVITGAGRGFGRALAVGLAGWGADIVAADVNKEEADETAEMVRQLGRRAYASRWDISKLEDGRRVAQETIDNLGDAHVLINNAGTHFRGDSDTAEAIEAWSRVIAVNLTGTYYATVSYIDQLKRTKGAVINIGSTQSFVGMNTKGAAYASTKGGMRLLMMEMAVEYAPFGIRVNGIAPGTTRTPMNSWIGKDLAKGEMLVTRIPMGRFGEPEELVGAALFLSSEKLSSYVNGVMIPVDGGFLAQ